MGINTGILSNAQPLSVERIKELERAVLENGQTFAYLDDNDELCFSMPGGVDTIRKLAWHKAYEIFSQDGGLVKQAYKKTGLGTYTKDGIFNKTSIDSDWQQTPGLYRNGELVRSWDALVADETIGYNADNNALYSCSPDVSGDLVISSDVTHIGESAFMECISLTGVTIPGSVSYIGPYAFSYCENLTSVTLGDGVSVLDGDTFEYCDSLTSITIPSSVTCVDASCFIGCYSLTRICVDPANADYCSDDYGALYNKDKTKLIAAPYKLTSISIPDSVTSIGNDVFNDHVGLTSITIPDSVTSIGPSAFKYCTSLTSITIPDSVTNIEYDAFVHCHGLTSITIPDSVTHLECGVLNGCYSLESITIPFVGDRKDTNYPRGYYPFEYIFGTEPYYNSVETTHFYYDEDNNEFSFTYYIPSSLKSVKVTGGTISYNAFSGTPNITSITLGDSVTSIDSQAFFSCLNLTSITIGDSVTSIGEKAFLGCSSLTNLTIPNSVTSIGEYAFAGCSSLTSITIPDSITRIEPYAFEYCSRLTSVTIPDSVTYIGWYAFDSCDRLASITIPDSVTFIGYHAFGECSGLYSITFEGTVAQWNALADQEIFAPIVPALFVRCADGKVEL